MLSKYFYMYTQLVFGRHTLQQLVIEIAVYQISVFQWIRSLFSYWQWKVLLRVRLLPLIFEVVQVYLSFTVKYQDGQSLLQNGNNQTEWPQLSWLCVRQVGLIHATDHSEFFFLSSITPRKCQSGTFNLYQSLADFFLIPICHRCLKVISKSKKKRYWSISNFI